MFADIAEGKATEGVADTKSKYDFSCAQILKVTGEKVLQAAVWHGNCDPDEFGSILVAIATYYNNAYLGWEINGPGFGIGAQIFDRCGYSNVYMRRPDADNLKSTTALRVGWRTTSKNKVEIVNALQRFLRERLITIYDIGTISELRVFSRLGANKWGAATGHDDRVMALGGALVIMEDVNALYSDQKKERIKEEEEAKDPEGPVVDEEPAHPILGTEF